MAGGFMYLVAIMDYFSRYVLSWSLSNSLESLFCMDALDEALSMSKPEVFHSDQGSQYSCCDFIDELKARKIKISMSGRGRCFDNILAERLWRTVKYEEVYLREYGDGHELIRSLREYFEYYNSRNVLQLNIVSFSNSSPLLNITPQLPQKFKLFLHQKPNNLHRPAITLSSINPLSAFYYSTL